MSRRSEFWLKAAEWKRKYCVECLTQGGDNAGYHDFAVKRAREEEPMWLEARLWDLFHAGLDTEWARKPRDKGPDLFKVSGVTIPEYITRPDGKKGYRQVAAEYASISDYLRQAELTHEKGLESIAAAATMFSVAREAQHRAGGRTDVLMIDVADEDE